MVATLVVATAGAGTVAATIAVGAAKGATISGTVAAVSHKISTGSWDGADNAALEEGTNGALLGAITGTISGAISSTVKVANAASKWGATYEISSIGNMNVHFKKHVIAENCKSLGANVIKYTNNASGFYETNKEFLKLTSSGSYRITAFFGKCEKMNCKYLKDEVCILKNFLEVHIPSYISHNVIGEYDLMECYEEMFNYIEVIIKKRSVDLNKNSYGNGPSFIFEKEYEIILKNISEKADYYLKIYCYLALASLMILKKLKDNIKGTILYLFSNLNKI